MIEDAVGKINITPRGPFAETWPYLMAMIRLIRDYQRAEYRDISEPNLLTVIAAILYFVSPFDVIPDWVPVLGHIGGRVVRPLRRVTRLARLPLALPAPLPAKFRIRFLEPVDTSGIVSEPELVERLLDDIRALIQENLLELVAERGSAWRG